MTCTRIGNGLICHSKVYRYKGYFFEWHSYAGPTPLKKNGEISQRTPKGFWDMVDEFQKLTPEEKHSFREI